MNKIQIQGLSFSLLAIVVALTLGLLAPTNPNVSLLILATLIFFFGVPHGALDPVFAQKILFLNSWQDWTKFVIAYLALSIAVVFIWWQLPLIFMGSFLLFSVMHFSRDLNDQVPKITRVLYGGSIIFLPSIFHFKEMQNLFSLILDADAGLQITSFLYLLAWPWLVGSLISIYFQFIRGWFFGLEILAVALLSTLASPLVSFTLYFCGMHSLRHILRTGAYSGLTLMKLGLVSLAPMLGVIFIAWLAWFYLPELPNYERILRLVFVGLAALTVPHMLLIDRVRYQQ
ncbi:MAG: Brp/Blh family beta-carotene 15,15'-dioxygenase [Nitrosospira sp.]|nr:Brp/Blh family beta-carotene 15,15'-dioxygenase [Nitrosospira sp.]MBI0407722.1 Brp/Blh family beta-carotene 15,15'-dioxygenase [Nitrosospira sp.]MBI0414624.1 Brp/Blh family beta-carotene 15,15'-dioxygenase [Nitrosospira sp.]MBI0415528.1 Brp/Blh family beta-carotene 15,15'-dioxygenase [Nitrosospira sp.]MBI0417380.1 Brp/Blh family beta-carotene 15,15'-dioxygenase [Nitrosospira sp.]